MAERWQAQDEGARAEAQAERVGDVETAGETTAAGTISGPAETAPVGAETLARVDERTRREESAADRQPRTESQTPKES